MLEGGRAVDMPLCMSKHWVSQLDGERQLGDRVSKKKERVALIMLIIALQFDVSTFCNEKTEINKMNKNCIVCVYTVSLSQLRNH